MTDKALCFDMYGTLCDTSSVTSTLSETLGLTDRFVAQVDRLWRQKQLVYSFQLNAMQEYVPFSEVTVRALDYTLEFYDLDPTDAEREAILASYDELDPYPDAVDAVERLSESGYTTAILSNGDPQMLEPLAEHAGFTPHLDAIVSADEVSAYKPTPLVYQNAAERLDTQPSACRLVSSNAWDIAGASNAGMLTGWVNRGQEPPERVGGSASLMVESLSGLATALLD